MRYGEIWWADLGEPRGSEPGYRRPVLIVSADTFNRSRIQTVVVVVLTSNLDQVGSPGNVWVTAEETGLSKDSVVNISQFVTVDKVFLSECVGELEEERMDEVTEGLRLVLNL